MPDFFTGPTCESENLEVVREIIPSPGADKKCHARLARFHPKIGNSITTRFITSFSLEITLGPCVCHSPAVATARILPRARRRLTLEEGVTLSRCLGM